MGFQRDNIPLAESRDGVSGGVWGNAPHKPSLVRHAPFTFTFRYIAFSS